MSKNEQVLLIDPAGRTTGPASLAQGVYGARGNLELLVPDAEDGLWVFWFNSDLDSDPVAAADVPPGTWSAGLRFAQGTRYLQGVIVQGTLGPDHLEVLALRADRVLESWYWSPGPGFQRRDATLCSGVSAVAAREVDGGTLEVDVRRPGGWTRVAADGSVYPERLWRLIGPAPEPAQDAGEIVSTRGGATRERVYRDAEGRLVHTSVVE